MTVERLKYRILDLVSTESDVTMSRLAHELPEFRDGTRQIYVAENVVIWTHATFEAAEALVDLVDRNIVVMQRCCLACHIRTGGYFMKLPLAKTKTNHDEPHWWPICLRPGVHLAATSGRAN